MLRGLGVYMYQWIISHNTGLFSVHKFDFILKDVLAAMFWEKMFY